MLEERQMVKGLLSWCILSRLYDLVQINIMNVKHTHMFCILEIIRLCFWVNNFYFTLIFKPTWIWLRTIKEISKPQKSLNTLDTYMEAITSALGETSFLLEGWICQLPRLHQDCVGHLLWTLGLSKSQQHRSLVRILIDVESKRCIRSQRRSRLKIEWMGRFTSSHVMKAHMKV